MTRSFSKNTAHSQIKLTALCFAMVLGWMVHGAPTLADNMAVATAEIGHLYMASIC